MGDPHQTAGLSVSDVPDFEFVAHRIAASIQHREADHDDLVQEALARLVGAIRNQPDLEDKASRLSFVQGVFRRAMLDYYERPYRQQERPAGNPVADDPGPFDVLRTIAVDDSVHARIFIDAFLEAVNDTLPARCSLIARELVDPSPAVIERAEETAATIRPRPEYVRQAYDIPSSTFYHYLGKLRDFTSDWIGCAA